MAEVFSEKALAKAKEIYETNEEVKKFVVASDKVKADGRGKYTRIQEVMSFIKYMGYKKIGLAHCAGFRNEAEALAEIFSANGIDLMKVPCNVGGKGCNTIGQAMILNEAGTDFNIVMGLCMGHDVIFSRFSDAPITTLGIKDRMASHNPIAPLHDPSWREKLSKNALA